MPPPPLVLEHTRRRSRLRWRLALVLGPLVLICFFGVRSSPFMQEIPWLPHALAAWADRNWVLRSFAGFFGLGLVWFPIVSARWPHPLGLALFGTVLELGQILIPRRVFDWKDIVASVAGVAAAWVVVLAAAALRRRAVERV